MTVLNHHAQLADNFKIRAVTSEVRGGGVPACVPSLEERWLLSSAVVGQLEDAKYHQ
jgi:hypothetical protein